MKLFCTVDVWLEADDPSEQAQVDEANAELEADGVSRQGRRETIDHCLLMDVRNAVQAMHAIMNRARARQPRESRS